MDRYEQVFGLDNAGPSKVQGPGDEHDKHDKSTKGADPLNILSCAVASKKNVPRDRVSEGQ